MDKGNVVCAVEYYSVMKRNGRMPFAAAWMNLETIVLEVKQVRQIPHVGFLWTLKYS